MGIFEKQNPCMWSDNRHTYDRRTLVRLRRHYVIHSFPTIINSISISILQYVVRHESGIWKESLKIRKGSYRAKWGTCIWDCGREKRGLSFFRTIWDYLSADKTWFSQENYFQFHPLPISRNIISVKPGKLSSLCGIYVKENWKFSGSATNSSSWRLNSQL